MRSGEERKGEMRSEEERKGDTRSGGEGKEEGVAKKSGERRRNQNILTKNNGHCSAFQILK